MNIYTLLYAFCTRTAINRCVTSKLIIGISLLTGIGKSAILVAESSNAPLHAFDAVVGEIELAHSFKHS